MTGQFDWSMTMRNVRTIPASEGKTQFLRLLDDVERGETIVITRHGRRIARIVPDADEGSDLAKKAFESIHALRRLNSPMTVDEILSARDEGRR
jgi:prevent-host-death family protein